jgi:hypothetical protein
MPRKRKESAYERRIRRYLAAHPGATRQEARGHRLEPGEREYRLRQERYYERHPAEASTSKAGLLARIRSIRRQGYDPVILLQQPAWMIPVESRKGRVDRLGPVPKLVVRGLRQAEGLGKEVGEQQWLFVLSGLTVKTLSNLIRDEIAAGATLTPAPSLDQQRILSEYAAGRLPGQ